MSLDITDLNTADMERSNVHGCELTKYVMEVNNKPARSATSVCQDKARRVKSVQNQAKVAKSPCLLVYARPQESLGQVSAKTRQIMR